MEQIFQINITSLKLRVATGGRWTSGYMFTSIKMMKIFFQTENYEVLPKEPLHDVKEHIANVLIELPSHLEKDEKKCISGHHGVHNWWKGKATWL